MVLIAVAIGFGLWALYSFTQGDKPGNDAVSQTSSDSAQEQSGSGAEGAGAADGVGEDAGEGASADRAEESGAGADGAGAGAEAGADGAAGGAGADAARADAAGAGPDKTGADSAGEASAEGGADVDAADVDGAAGATANPADFELVVLNNSTVKGLASKKADELKGQGYEVVHVGNLADQVLPETTVYYNWNSGDASGAEAAAKKLANELGGVAKQKKLDDKLPQEAKETEGLVVVLTAS